MQESATYSQDDFSLVWSDGRKLGYGPMDAIHEEFYLVAFRLLTCSAETADAALTEFEEHARSHFAEEEKWMESTAFPPRDCHVEEHATVLKSIVEVRSAIAEGRANERLVHDFALYLFRWFPGHADYLDSALAAWISKCKYGGKPVVLRLGEGRLTGQRTTSEARPF